jgi:enamine deaminase RidA (YjgF/YER057c/UK114 family)
MKKIHNPQAIAAPIGTYSHGIEVPPNARWLHVAGQVAVRKDGLVPATIAEQTVVAWENVTAILASAGMQVSDIVKVNQYLTEPAHFPGYASARARFLGDHRPASTLVMISALVKPEFLVEVEAVAAKAGTTRKPAKRPQRAGVKTRKRAAAKRRR